MKPGAIIAGVIIAGGLTALIVAGVKAGPGTKFKVGDVIHFPTSNPGSHFQITAVGADTYSVVVVAVDPVEAGSIHIGQTGVWDMDFVDLYYVLV